MIILVFQMKLTIVWDFEMLQTGGSVRLHSNRYGSPGAAIPVLAKGLHIQANLCTAGIC